MDMQLKILMRFVLVLLFCFETAMARQNSAAENTDTQAAAGLIGRVLPAYASRFILEHIPKDKDKDVFELETRNGKVELRGNNGVSIASAFHYWLKHYAHCQITWN